MARPDAEVATAGPRHAALVAIGVVVVTASVLAGVAADAGAPSPRRTFSYGVEPPAAVAALSLVRLGERPAQVVAQLGAPCRTGRPSGWTGVAPPLGSSGRLWYALWGGADGDELVLFQQQPGGGSRPGAARAVARYVAPPRAGPLCAAASPLLPAIGWQPVASI
jgi:hypothetical protein